MHKLDSSEQITLIRPCLLIITMNVPFAHILPMASSVPSSGPSDDAQFDPRIPLSLVTVIALCESASLVCSLDCSK